RRNSKLTSRTAQNSPGRRPASWEEIGDWRLELGTMASPAVASPGVRSLEFVDTPSSTFDLRSSARSERRALPSSNFHLPASRALPNGRISRAMSCTPYHSDFLRLRQNFFETPSTRTRISLSFM